jgi:MFS family permease
MLTGRHLVAKHAPCAARRRVVPSAALVPVCLMPVGVMAIEGVVMDWSAIFLTDTLAADPFPASLGYLVFSVAMAGARLTGDRVTARIGPTAHSVASGGVAAAGTLVFATAPTLPVAFLGAFVAGLGAASIYPIALSIAARRTGAIEDNLAAVAFTSFLLLLGLPALFGLLVELTGQRGAFAAVAGLAAPSMWLALRIGGPTRSVAR